MDVQVIERDGEPEYAVLPWAQYQALLKTAGYSQAVRPAAPSAAPAPAKPRFAELSRLRQERGLSTEHLARAVGISPAYLELIERGEREASEPIRFGLARALQVDGWGADD